MSSIATLICSDRIQDSNGQTALFNVAMKGNLVDCQLLNEHGADINTRADERTPLYGAVEFGHHDVALWFFHHPNYDRKWDNNLFTLLCGQSAKLIAPYLDLFVVGLYRNEPHTPDFPTEYSSRQVGTMDLRPPSTTSSSLRSMASLASQFPKQRSHSRSKRRIDVKYSAAKCYEAKWFAFGKTMFRQEVVVYCLLVLTYYVSIMCDQAHEWSGFSTPREVLVGILRFISCVCLVTLLIQVEHRELLVESVTYFCHFGTGWAP